MRIRRFIVVLSTLALLLSLAGNTAAAEPKQGNLRKVHDKTSPQITKQRAERAKGFERVMKGQATTSGRNKVVRLGKGQYVELAREGEDSILTVLAQFGNGTPPHSTPDHPTAGSHGGTNGPLHNQIPAPNRRVDNSTIWKPDFSEAYFEDLLFGETPGASTMRNYYIEQSSNRYTVNGDVTPWVQVPNNAATYGADYCGDIVCMDTWLFVNDSVDAFAATFGSDEVATAALNAYLAQFDLWDRYDADGDGKFNESDGYIDHFQSVHAGEGEETGGGAQGEDAIWSHRWYAYFDGDSTDGTGPVGHPKLGGLKIGNSNYWIGDYTVEPENGGVGVFAHEFGHDLGLPDLYDTSGNTGGAENSTGFWTLYSSGSYGSTGIPSDGIGSKPVHLGAYEKLVLDWLNVDILTPGQKATIKIGPSEYNTVDSQGVLMVLPNRIVPLNLGAPCPTCGTKFFYSGQGDGLDVTMTKTTGVSAGVLTAKVRYQTELDWDFAFLESSTDGGTTWTKLVTNKSLDSSHNKSGINSSGTGMSGTTSGAWVDLSATLPAGTNAVRFRYVTDGAVALPGFQVDNIAIGGTSIGTAETGETGWTLAGFRTTTGSETQSFFNAYIVENRQYLGFDKSLQTGPYNFGYASTKPNWVEHFPYEAGILISYYNSQYTDNNVGDHPGEGLVLPIDSHPELAHWKGSDHLLMRPRLQSFDSTFGPDKVDKLRVHLNGKASEIDSSRGVSVFNDMKTYWSNCDRHGCTGSHPGHDQPGWVGVNNPHTGATVKVGSTDRHGVIKVRFNN